MLACTWVLLVDQGFSRKAGGRKEGRREEAFAVLIFFWDASPRKLCVYKYTHVERESGPSIAPHPALLFWGPPLCAYVRT